MVPLAGRQRRSGGLGERLRREPGGMQSGAMRAACADACAGVGGMGYISVVWPESDDGTGGGGHVVPDLVLVVVPSQR